MARRSRSRRTTAPSPNLGQSSARSAPVPSLPQPRLEPWVDLSNLLPDMPGKMLPARRGYSVDQDGIPDVPRNAQAPVQMDRLQKAFNQERLVRLNEGKEPIGSICKTRPDGRKRGAKGGKSFSPWCK